MKKNLTATVVLAAIIIASQSTPANAEGTFTVTSGIDYSSGKYGQSNSTYITYVPFIAKFATDTDTFKLTIPWLKITGPGEVVGADAINLNGTNHKVTTESGLGDASFSASHTLLNYGVTNPLSIDLTGKIKFATASKAKGLGTGENDYTIELESAKAFSNTTSLFGGLGYKLMGDPNGINLNNVWFYSLGLSYKLNPSTSVGIMTDYRQKTLDSSDSLRETTAFVAHRINTQYKLQGYIIHGYSNVSANWGGGLMLGYAF